MSDPMECPARAGSCEKEAGHDGPHYTTYRGGVWQDRPGIDVERLARAFIAQREYVTYPSGWRDSDLRWLARQVAAEYNRLPGHPDTGDAEVGE